MAGLDRGQRRRSQAPIIVVALVVVVVAVVGFAAATREADSAIDSSADPTPAPASAEHQVTSIVDGDTLHVRVGGQDATVRVVGIDAPETSECWGAQATEAAAALLTGTRVQLIADPSQADTDRYGRLLRYVLLPDGTDLGTRMITDGNAYEYTYDAPYDNQDAYRSAQAASEADGRGLWSAGSCRGRRSLPEPTTTATTTTSERGACDIKGNINADDDRIYHVPGGNDYHRTKIDEAKGERWFCSVAEAEADGWRAPFN